MSDFSGAKKRRRTPLSCETCRIKKIKCDRTKPKCLKCINMNIECQYNSPNLMTEITKKDFSQNHRFVVSLVDTNTSTNTNSNTHVRRRSSDEKITTVSKLQESERQSLLTQIEYLKAQLDEERRQFDPETECISFVIDFKGKLIRSYWSKRNVRFQILGSVLITSFWKRDPLMCRFVKNFFGVKERVKNEMKKGNADKNANKVVERYFPQKDIAKLDGGEEEFEFIEREIDIKKGNSSMVDEVTFAERVCEILPPAQVLEFHLQNFFRIIYPFIPIIDEPVLRASVDRIVEYPAEGGRPHLTLKTKIDHIRISTLLLILRLSYLQIYLKTKFNKSKKKKNEDDEDVEMYPINPDIIPLIHYSLFHFNFMRKTSIEVYQLLLLFRYYQTHSCEDSDGYSGSDGTIITGVLYSTFQALGLDREFPEGDSQKVYCFVKHHGQMDLLSRGVEPFLHLWKKLRLVSVQMDLKHSMLFGYSPRFDTDLYDVEIGKIEYGIQYSNVNDLETECMANDSLNKFQKIQPVLSKLMKAIHDVKKKASIVLIERMIVEIELLLEQNYDLLKLKNYSTPFLTNTAKTMMIQEKLKVECILISIEYALLLHCEYICNKGGDHYEVGMNRFTKLMPKFTSRCISMTNEITFIWNNVQNEDDQDLGDNSFTPYLLMLGYTFNETFTKLTMCLFYVAIRLSKLNTQIDTIYAYKYTSKQNEFQRMYKSMLNIFKRWIKMSEKLSHYWYSSLRNYCTIRNFIEWFENGGKFVFDFDVLNDDEKMKDQDMLTNLISRMFFSIEDKTLQELNFKFEMLEGTEDVSDVPTVSTEVSNDYEVGSGEMPGISINEDSGKFFRNLEMNDWEDVYKWFTQTPVFDTKELEGFESFQGYL